MAHPSARLWRPGAVGVGIVVGLMFVTPIIAATSTYAFDWETAGALAVLHKDEIALASLAALAAGLLLKAAATAVRRRRWNVRVRTGGRARGLDGLA